MEKPERIEGEGFTLRRWNIEDAAWYVTARDEEIFQWTNERRDLTIAEAEQAIQRANASRDALCFAIVDPVNQELLGNIALKFEEARPETGEIMYWLAPAGRGRGIATMAVRRLCQWAFQTMRLDRITLKTMRGNARSQRVAERAGFHLLPGQADEDTGVEYIWFELRGSGDALWKLLYS